MKIKILKENLTTGYREYATLHQKTVNQQLAQNQTYTITHTGVGEGLTILYTGSIEITNITIDGNTVLNAAVPITSNPAVLLMEWGSSMSITIQATSSSSIYVLYMGT
jgi:uroporphyrinogen-III decarboxylase